MHELECSLLRRLIGGLRPPRAGSKHAAGSVLYRHAQGGIRSWQWGYIDLKTGIIRLKSGHAQTHEGRVIPLNQALTSLPKSSTRSLV